MTNPKVHFVVSLAINDGKLAQFQSVAQEMIAGTVKEAGALGYEWFLSADRKRCRLVETYVDPDAVLAHMSGPVVRNLVPKMLETASLSSFEVYGDPGAEAGKTLAGIGAEIFPFWHGLKG
ncbi:MAG: antibiotic biosynthesis monooxygenase [Candidatus Sulfotelmatobacter sp.]